MFADVTYYFCLDVQIVFCLLSEKEAKIAKEKELGIYKEKKVTVTFSWNLMVGWVSEMSNQSFDLTALILFSELS